MSLTHQSHADRFQLGYNNERLEFLGDAVLDQVVSEFLYKKYPQGSEGDLTKLRSAIVNRKSLNKLAKAIDLLPHIRTEVDLNLPGVSLPGNAFEAFVGAVYLDMGYAKARDFMIDRVIAKHLNLEELEKDNENHKSILLEWSQKVDRKVKIEIEEANDESREFVAKIWVDDDEYGVGQGRSKKIAEQGAALEALQKLGIR